MDGIISSFFPSVFQTTKIENKDRTCIVAKRRADTLLPAVKSVFVCVGSAEILAPIGYPQRKPAMIAKLPFERPGRFLFRKEGRTGGQSDGCSCGHQQVCGFIKKKGKQCGKDRMKPSSRPLLAPLNTSFENKSIKAKQIRTPIPARFFLIGKLRFTCCYMYMTIWDIYQWKVLEETGIR